MHIVVLVIGMVKVTRLSIRAGLSGTEALRGEFGTFYA